MSEENTAPAVSPDAVGAADGFRAFLDSQKAEDIAVININGPQSIADILIVATASSRRHAQGMADGINRLCKERGYEFLGMEGYDLAEWILVDCNNVLVNILQEEPRKLYKLEELWKRRQRAKNKEGLK